jgi:hypothetical protein
MTETKSEAVSTSGFKVRPLSTHDETTQKSEIEGQKSEDLPSKTNAGRPRLRELTEELRALEVKLRLGGGPDKIAKLTARETIDLLLDKDF